MITRFFIVLWTLVWCSVATFFALWSANIINYILSIPIGAVGLVLEALVSEAHEVWQFVYLFITFGLVYLVIFSVLFCFAFRHDGLIMDECPKLGYIILFLLMFVVIVLCDIRVDLYMPEFCLNVIEFNREEWNYFILAPIDWYHEDLSGQNVTSMHYNVIDTSITLSGIIAVLNNRYWWWFS
jgi:hypothetical protein